MKVDILGKPYRVVEATDGQMPDSFGTASCKDQIITLKKSMAAGQKADTMLHEVIHIISNELALELPEDTIRRLAVGLHSAGVKVAMKK